MRARRRTTVSASSSSTSRHSRSAAPGAGVRPSDTVRFVYTSLTTPGTVYDENLRTGERVLRKRQPVLGDFDPDRYRCERVFATAPDGTQVPISLVYRKDRARRDAGRADAALRLRLLRHLVRSRLRLNAHQPARSRLHLRDRVTSAAAAISADPWYDERQADAQEEHLQRLHRLRHSTLIDSGLHPKARAGIRGGSAGGLLMGAVDQSARPDLCSTR